MHGEGGPKFVLVVLNIYVGILIVPVAINISDRLNS